MRMIFRCWSAWDSSCLASITCMAFWTLYRENRFFKVKSSTSVLVCVDDPMTSDLLICSSTLSTSCFWSVRLHTWAQPHYQYFLLLTHYLRFYMSKELNEVVIIVLAGTFLMMLLLIFIISFFCFCCFWFVELKERSQILWNLQIRRFFNVL